MASRPARSLIALRWWLTERPRLLLAWAVLLGVPLAVPVLAFAWLRWCLCCWRVLFGG